MPPQILPPGPDDEPRPIMIDHGQWLDQGRDRIIPYKIYRPETLDEKPYPVVIWSHGLGGTRDGASFLARYLAAHGFIHVHIQHDGTDDSLWRGMSGHPWDNIRKAVIPYETVRDRYLDVPFAVDMLVKMAGEDAFYADAFDFTRLGISGHSFGALTAQVMAGQLAGRAGPYEDLSDKRFKAGILYSPVPAFRHQESSDNAYARISIPLLHMTGTRDESPVEGFGYERRMEVFRGAGKDQDLLIIKDADHMVFNGSRGQLPNYDGVEDHKNLIKQMALMYWRAVLNGNGEAQNWLGDGSAQNWLGVRGVYQRS